MKKSIGIISAIILSSTLNAQSISEGFDNVFSLYAGGNWFTKNNSNPSNSYIWYQDAGNFTAYSGTANSSITAGWYCTDTVGTGDASVWLFTPPVILNNGDSISFYTISYNNAVYPDRLELRLNTTTTDTLVGTTATSVGNYTTVLLTINPSLDFTSYPMVWTKYSVMLTGITGGPGRIAFRYVVPNTGGSGTNGSVVGIDDFNFKSIISTVSEPEKNGGLQLFPNPANDKITITCNENKDGNYSIYDAAGKMVLTTANSTINIQHLQKGIYTLRFMTQTASYNQKFVKD